MPYLNQVIIADVADETAQVDSLLSGEFDVVNLLSVASIRTLESQGAGVVISAGGGWTPFTMRVDVPPFNDPRVREAMKLIVNRKQMRELVFGGHGTLGNDLMSIWDPSYDHGLPQREQDINKAKSLLRSAGREGLTVELVTAPISGGTVQAATVLKQQAVAAGVTINVRQLQVTDFYGPNYLKWIFAQDFVYYTRYLPSVAEFTLPTSPYNECHFHNPRYSALYSQALAAVNEAKRREIAYEMQQIDYSSSGYIIPYFPPQIDGHAAHVHGLEGSKLGVSLNDYNFRRVWLG